MAEDFSRSKDGAPDFLLPDNILNTSNPGFPINTDPVTGFPLVNGIGENPVGPVLPGNNPIGISIANSFMSGWSYRGVPYTQDSNRTINPIGMPSWFTRGALHRAKWVVRGPYNDPQGLFFVPEDYVLVNWELRQGTPQYTPPQDQLIPAVFAILPIDETFITGNNAGAYNSLPLLAQYVNYDLTLAKPGDDVAVWFSFTRPAHVIGLFPTPEDFGYGRNNSGSIGHR